MENLNELALFAGAGGGILGGKLLGWRTVCAVERDAYAAQVLAQRQNDGILEAFPIWSDVCSFDGKPWRGIVDIISGGFPCQDISVAGRGAGIEGTRSGLWKQMLRIICEVEPKIAYMENSPALTVRGLGVVLGDLAEIGFDAEWGVLSCADVGGVHKRERIWIKAANTKKLQRYGGADNREYSREKISKYRNSFGQADIADAQRERGKGKQQEEIQEFSRLPWGEDIRSIEDLRVRSDIPKPLICRVNNDVAFGVDRLKAVGNGQVPRVAATAFNLLTNGKVNRK
jgi:DNA (cytosine-5)-methyltransferase 1